MCKKSTQNIKDKNIIIHTYKHKWSINTSNGICVIQSRNWYPLGFLKIFSKKLAFLAKDKKVTDNPSLIYEADSDISLGTQKFTTQGDIELQEDRADIFCALLKRYGVNVHGKSVLDISGGSGVFVKQLLNHGAISVSNTEFSKGAVDYGKEILDIPAYYFDINKHKLSEIVNQNIKYDVVMLRGCIEFCDNLEELIDELKIITHKQSILILTFVDPTLGVALRTQFDQYNLKICRPPTSVNETFTKKGYTTLIDSEMFLFDRNYAFRHLKNPLGIFYIFYLILGLFKLRKHSLPIDFHALDAKCALMAYRLD